MRCHAGDRAELDRPVAGPGDPVERGRERVAAVEDRAAAELHGGRILIGALSLYDSGDRPGRGACCRYALRANTAASDGAAASAWALTSAPSARPAEAYACPPRLGASRERVGRAGGGQGGAPSGLVRLTPRMQVRHAAPSLGPYRRHQFQEATTRPTQCCSIARLEFRHLVRGRRVRDWAPTRFLAASEPVVPPGVSVAPRRISSAIRLGASLARPREMAELEARAVSVSQLRQSN